MMPQPAAVASALLKACRLDVVAFKPGNVSLSAPGHGMLATDFLRSAEAAVPALCAPGISVGARIERAIDATREVVNCNTNLGIVLLLAPLAAAALRAGPHSLRARVASVLDELTVDDSAACFRAIRKAGPAGLGSVPEQDVHAAPGLELRAVMRLAADRDRVAAQYADNYADIFERGVPWLLDYRSRWRSLTWATTACFVQMAAAAPDSHVARKFGAGRAEALQGRFRAVVSAVKACENPRLLVDRLSELDRGLKTGGVNPGTSADLTVASVAALLLQQRHPIE